jgi:hypothetical protein
MSTLTQFFAGGGGGSSKIPAEILVVGGGAAAANASNSFNGISPFFTPGGSFGSCTIPGAAGGIIFAHSFLTPGATCPIQVGSGHPVATPVNCCYTGPTPGTFNNCCSFSFFSGSAGASFFGGSSGLCAGGGISCYQVFTPTPTCTFTCQGILYSRNGNLNVSACASISSIFDAKNYFNPNRSGSVINCFGTSFFAIYAGAGSYAQNGSPYITGGLNFKFDNTRSGPGGSCPGSGFSRTNSSGFVHDITGCVEVYGSASVGDFRPDANPTYQAPIYRQPIGFRASFPGPSACCTYGGENTGSGGHNSVGAHPCSPCAPVQTSCRAGRNGTVVVRYPTDYPAAPSFPGACDCSPQTPGYRTYRFVSSGSITLP